MKIYGIALVVMIVCSIKAIGANDKQDIVIYNVNIVDVKSGKVKTEQTVMINDGVIKSIKPSGEDINSKGVVVINGKGKYLMPGLWDTHIHTSSDDITRKTIYPLLIANGVLAVVNMRGDCFDKGGNKCGKLDTNIKALKKRQEDIKAGTLTGPIEIGSSAFSNGVSANGKSSKRTPGTPEDGREFVRLANKRGADFIKIYDKTPKEVYFAIMDEAKKQGMFVVGHVPVEVKMSEASKSGQVGIAHLGAGNLLEACSSKEEEIRPKIIAAINSDNPDVADLMQELVESFSEEKCKEAYRVLVNNRTWITPTLMAQRLPEEIMVSRGTGAQEDYLPKEERELMSKLQEDKDRYASSEEEREYVNWVKLRTQDAYKNGVRLLVGTDAGYPWIVWGFAIHDEMSLMVNAGLSEIDVLRGATLYAAEAFNKANKLGSVEEGKLAELIILNSNPLIDISNTRNISGVITNGDYLDSNAINKLLQGVKDFADLRQDEAVN